MMNFVKHSEHTIIIEQLPKGLIPVFHPLVGAHSADGANQPIESSRQHIRKSTPEAFNHLA